MFTAGLIASAVGLAVLLGRARTVEARLEQVAALKASGNDQPPPAKTLVYYVNPSQTPAPAPGEGDAEKAKSQAGVEEPAGQEPEVEASAEERRQAAVDRHQRLMDAFQGQTAADYQPRRSQALVDNWEVNREALGTRPDRTLGEMDCRGRMCTLPVTFGGDEALAGVVAAARRSARGVGVDSGGAPLVHFMALPAGLDGTAKGSFFFEWP
jgi:hypothetical protein